MCRDRHLATGAISCCASCRNIGVDRTVRNAANRLVQPHTTADTVAYYNGEQVRLVGVVSDRPDERDTRMQVQLSVEELSTGMRPTQCTGKCSSQPRRTDGLGTGSAARPRGPAGAARFRGFLLFGTIWPLGTFIRSWLIRSWKCWVRGVATLSSPCSMRCTDRLRAVIYQILPDPEAGLLNGILLGVYDALPQRVLDSFNATGTSHIIVISGFNITILATLLLRIFNQVVVLVPTRPSWRLSASGSIRCWWAPMPLWSVRR